MSRHRRHPVAIGMLALLVTGAEASDRAALVREGEAVFFRCNACHSIGPAGPLDTGPSLQNIIGRRAGGLPGYAYTPALQGRDFHWTRRQLDRWLKAPQAILPGVCLPFTGIESRRERRALIEYLAQPLP
ncbi:MAG: hypothetical protein RL026_79 [Pseudomonadota bacterium]|jgi:cytochrome c2